MRVRLVLLFLILTIFPGLLAPLLAQASDNNTPPPVHGVPGITHYQRQDFNADPQFWSVCEDAAGILYFGNNDGALVFDGERWHKVFLPNNSAVRSLTADAEGNVYAGGYNEMGLIRQDAQGRYYYTSLLDSLSFHDSALENLWQVHAISGAVVYRSFNKLVAIRGKNVTALPASSSFLRSYTLNDKLYVLDRVQGLLRLDVSSLQFSTVFPAEAFDNEFIVALLPAPDPSNFVAFAGSGKVYLLNPHMGEATLWKDIFQDATQDQLINAIQGTNGQYYLGTLSSRIIAMDGDGSVNKDEQNFQRIQDKTVLNLFQTSKGNIWALLNNGLDYIDFNSPVSTLFDNASIYDVLVQQDKMYLATNQGFFYTPLRADGTAVSSLSFEKIKGTEGQAWSLQLVDGQVLGAHDHGLFELDEAKSTRIGSIDGIWKVIPAAGSDTQYLACSYNGLYLLEKEANQQWRVLHKISGFNESSRDILAAETPGTYWVCHGYKGVFRIKLDADHSRVTAMEHFTTQNGLPSPFNVNVFRWENNVVFTTNGGIYSYDLQNNQFVPFMPLNQVLDAKLNTRKLLQFRDKTWFVQDDEAGYFITAKGKSTLQKELFLQFKSLFNRGMECIVPLDEQRVLFGTNLGLYLFDFSNEQNPGQVQTHISSVRYTLNQEELGLPVKAASNTWVQLPHTTNTIRFEFASPGMQNNTNVQYSFLLQNVDEDWSAWKNTPYKEYTHLRPGRYTFKVRSRSLLGVNGKESIYYFEVMPIWYNTPWAWGLYIVAAALLVVLLVWSIGRKIAYENDKTRQEEQKARKLLELEIQQMRLQSQQEQMLQEKELLEEDVIYKSKELANYTMLLVKKREVFSELLQDLKTLRELAKNETSRTKLREIVKKVGDHLSDEEHLHVFETNFEKVHHDFFTKLKELYPDLNQRDLRLCAFVKMNLTNKEISPLLNISVRGVETARYRIRKKLNLEHEHNLVEYLESLSPTTQEPEVVD
ncbi:hypothetical protein D770_25530 [Flammeovirgaceae bacterium 311]|nr:hypothetical protein D770_25530 [Flammeovirgaceae bacterium 311]